jgi:pyridoxal phosphate enzyme (YggS family)
MDKTQSLISQNFQQVMEKISICASKANRSVNQIKLVVVTKNQSVGKILEVIEAGATYIGENYPEETIEKWNQIKENCSNSVQIHLIGHLQSRKIPLIINRFDAFQALDSIRLAEKINARIIQEQKNPLKIFMQFNVSGENEKFGWPADDEKKWPILTADFERIIAMNGLQLAGLMTMPPFVDTSEENRIYFDRLRRLRDFFVMRYPEIQLSELSMGTSQDYRTAIMEGATFLRIGTLIMGSRDRTDKG